MNAREAAMLIDVVALSWPSRFTAHPDKARQVSVWQRMLNDVEYGDAEAAVVAMVRGGEVHPPDLPRIISAVADAHAATLGMSVPDLDDALAEINFYASRRGTRLGPPDEWSHPAIFDALAGFKWSEVVQGGDTFRAHLMRAYSAASERHRRVQRERVTELALEAGEQLRGLQAPSDGV